MYTALFEAKAFGTDSRSLLRHLEKHRIQCRPLWQPLHLSTAHRGAFATECSTSERLYRDALTLPSSVGLTPTDQRRVIDAVRQAVPTKASR